MSDQEEKEVKTEEEDIKSTEEEDDDSTKDENDTQSESSADENEEESTDDEDESDEEDSDDESDEDKSEDEDNDSDKDSKDDSEGDDEGLLDTKLEKGAPKRVEGETPREFALRCEVHRLKTQRRTNKGKELFKTDTKGKITVNTDTLSDEDEKLLASYNKDELADFEKMMGVIAKKRGWVNKEDLHKTTYQERGEEVLQDFLDVHPEYSSENDPDNVLWKRFQEDFSLYKKPDNPKTLKRIFEKIHRDIFEVLPVEGLNKVNAQKQKIKSASHSGAARTKKGKSPEPSGLDPELKKHLKGFDDKELDEMFT